MTMVKWEYKELTIPCNMRDKKLNLLGEKGWECYSIKHFSIVAPGEESECTIFLKRPKTELLLESSGCHG